MQILSNTLAFVFALGVIVFVHEAGHYAVAKSFGVRILTFSLGFGRRIWGFRRGGTDYQVCLIPLGGYVSFGGHDPSERSSDPSEFPNRPRWQRVLVLLAGPAANVVLAIVLVAVVFMTGFAVRDVKDLPAVVGAVGSGSAGETAGLVAGDLVVEIEGEAVTNWQEVIFSVITSPAHALTMEVEGLDGASRNVTLVPDTLERDQIGEAGIYPLVIVGEVVADGAAEAAGVQVDDAILAVDGVAVESFGHLREQVVDRAGQELDVLLLRGRREVELRMAPRESPNGAMIGVGQPFKRYGIGEAIVESVRFNADLTRQIFFLLDKLLENRISLRASIGGPIEIAAVSGAAARSGFRELLLFMSFISINLCIFNLFPIPILDGGQIAILLVESTLRRDLSLRLKERITQMGLVMIVMLMAMALYFDLSKNLPTLLDSGREAGVPESQSTE